MMRDMRVTMIMNYPQVMRPVDIFSVFTTEASFNLAEYKEAQHTISPFIPRQPRILPFHEGVHWNLTFQKTLTPMPEVDSNDEEYFQTADLDDLMWSEEPMPDSQEYLCVHEIPRPATPPPQHNQVDMPATQPPHTTRSGGDDLRPWTYGTRQPGGHAWPYRHSGGSDLGF